MPLLNPYRSWGLDTPRDHVHWRQSAACRLNPDLWLELPPTSANGTAGHAIHICLTHCPVLAQCTHETTLHDPPIAVIQAGRLWRGAVYRRQRPRRQPADPGCGTWCALHRTLPAATWEDHPTPPGHRAPAPPRRRTA